ncbi:dTDP-L-rhamnose 4-epimerase [Thalassococcus halodurans]|uniref:dTDP-L-rhamnose 4-epimerase n=1 Tax=Thalassococcus halodurans TaxID=373675 RepID=A0A1H5XEG4_9RHOB|nr:NAD-dependent epimerase/dehydratase family protein [Thalassococcus halodurans]SEG10043.1 dTDP-L-rhamnose 4-epimerase [Thalassococcus halodurans]
MPNILITGGAGFIGKRLALSLRNAGHSVTVFDNLHPQVHPDPEGAVAELKQAGARFSRGDVLDGGALTKAIIVAEADIVIHLAAETGTGQSYDLPVQYCDVNVTGTARLIEAIRAARTEGIDVSRVILAGSRAVYGEGACRDGKGREVTAVPRLSADLATGDFAPKDAQGRTLEPIASCAATTVPAPASIYASTKLMQEYLLRQGLEQSGIEASILRLQNVYGAGQSLHNPYTGVLSIFAQQLLEGKTLNIYEDGEIVRDFVHVSDVVSAFHRLCELELVPQETADIGSGKGASILEVAQTMIEVLDLVGERLTISGQFRPGDVRHAVADISAAERYLDWKPQVSLSDGIRDLIDWARKTG